MANSLHILKLINQLAENTGNTTDRYGFGRIEEIVESERVTQRYLYDLYRRATKNYEAGKDTIAEMPFLNAIAKYLGYANFPQFTISVETPVSEVLRSCSGLWWSFVRSNYNNSLFKAPVKIYLDAKEQRMRIELKGRERLFFGVLGENGSCMSSFLESGTDKKIGMFFKLGSSRQMEVLQGTFCGISSSNIPIAGREILVREKKLNYNDMTWSAPSFSDELIDERIRNYFSEHNKNCVKINETSSFDFSDL